MGYSFIAVSTPKSRQKAPSCYHDNYAEHHNSKRPSHASYHVFVVAFLGSFLVDDFMRVFGVVEAPKRSSYGIPALK